MSNISGAISEDFGIKQKSFLNKIVDYVYSLFNSDIYWDEYGIYDRESGLIVDYFVPEPVVENKTNVIKEINNFDDNFAKNLSKKVDSDIKNAKFKKAVTVPIVPKQIVRYYDIASIDRENIVHKNGNHIFTMTLCDELPLQKDDVFSFRENSELKFKVIENSLVKKQSFFQYKFQLCKTNPGDLFLIKNTKRYDRIFKVNQHESNLC